MVCLRFAVCLATVLLAVCCRRAHSQTTDCGVTINITTSINGDDLFPEDVNITCFECYFGVSMTTDNATTWTLGGDIISPSQGVIISGVLVIIDPIATIGILTPKTLVCTSPSGMLSVFVQALALVPPEIDDMTVNEGDTLTLTCDFAASTRILSQRWTGPDGGNISTLRTLTIADIQRTQSGVYTCFITNFQDNIISGSGTVSVQYAPDVDTPISSPHLSPIGQPLILSCSYDALPTPNVTWMREGVELNLTDSRLSVTPDTISRSSELTVTDLQRDEGGNYVCMFTNEVGSGVASIQVIVQVPPDPVSDPRVTGRSTETFDLSWNNPLSDGNSPLTGIRIEYQTDNNISNVVNISVMEMTTLMNLEPFTSYNISILVLNDVGPSDPVSVTDRTDSLIPEAPGITNVTAINSTALYVEWEAPHNSSTTAPIESFVVQYSEVGEALLSSETTTNTFFVLTGLDKGASYTVSVATRNEAGQGPFSEEMTAETTIDPPTPPQNVTVVGLTSRVLTVMWDPPLDPGGRDIVRYELEVRELGEMDFEVPGQSVGAAIREARIVDRTENTTYEVRVTAFSTLPGESAVAMGMTPSIGEPQALLVAPLFDMVTGSSVRLSWDDPGGEVNFYIIEYNLRISPDIVRNITVNGTSQMATIFGLSDRSTYEARIRTRNDNGDSEPSPTVTFVTSPRLDVSGPTDEVIAGELVTLTCSISGGGSPSANVQWFRGTNGALPEGATVNREVLTFTDPQPGDSGVYTCSSGGETASFTLAVQEAPTTTGTTPGTTEETGISDTIIIVVAVVGGVALVVFLIVLTIAICYCCRQRRNKANKGVFTVRSKQRGNWIETSGGAGSAAAAGAERPPARAPSFHIPSEFTSHSSFNTLEKQNRIRRSRSPDPKPTQGANGQGGVAYAQLDLSRPSADVQGSTGDVQYTQVSATAAPAVSHEVGSPTFQYIPQESLGFPAPQYGSGPVLSPENYDMTWPDGNIPPHYSNTVV